MRRPGGKASADRAECWGKRPLSQDRRAEGIMYSRRGIFQGEIPPPGGFMRMSSNGPAWAGVDETSGRLPPFRAGTSRRIYPTGDGGMGARGTSCLARTRAYMTGSMTGRNHRTGKPRRRDASESLFPGVRIEPYCIYPDSREGTLPNPCFPGQFEREHRPLRGSGQIRAADGLRGWEHPTTCGGA